MILYGPSGTGKTLLSKAVSHETNATFLHVIGSELTVNIVENDDGPKLVRELFRTAHEYSPSIIFIDEIDAIATWCQRFESI